MSDGEHILASGNVAMILKSNTADDRVVKVQYTSRGAEESIDPAEADINRLLWNTLAESNISMHVCRPCGVVTTAGGHMGLEMERLRGLAPDVLNMEQLIMHAGMGAMNPDEFPNLFRSLLFQTIFTLSACTYVFNGFFRHNDLHLRNVCFTPWNDARAPVSAMYSLRCFPHSREDAFVDRHFLLHTAYRAVMIDFGWSALLPPLGPLRDPRFFEVATSGHDHKPVMVDILASEPRFKDCGMSQQLPCQQYDLALFLFSVAALCRDVAKHSACPPAVQHELEEFLVFYNSFYADVPMVAGRIPLAVQAHLQRSRKTQCGVPVPTAEGLLRSDYFAWFRCAADTKAAVAFGVPHAQTRPPCSTSLRGDSALASKSEWSLVQGRWRPSVAPFALLVTTVYDNIAKWADVRSRGLTAEEESAWIQPLQIAAPLIVSKWQDAYCISPKTRTGLVLSETVVVRSPEK